MDGSIGLVSHRATTDAIREEAINFLGSETRAFFFLFLFHNRRPVIRRMDPSRIPRRIFLPFPFLNRASKRASGQFVGITSLSLVIYNNPRPARILISDFPLKIIYTVRLVGKTLEEIII